MRASSFLRLSIAIALGAVVPGCMVPGSPRTWVSYHATIDPTGPDGRWNAEEVKLVQDSLAASATHSGLTPTSEWAGPDLLGIRRRRNAKAMAELAVGKTSRLCYLGEFSKGDLVRVDAYYRPGASPPHYNQGKLNLILVDYTYSKTAPITPAEVQQADSEWATFFQALDARFGSRMTVHVDKVLRRND